MNLTVTLKSNMRYFVFFLTTLYSGLTFAFLNTQTAANGLSGAYGYLYGQEESLKNIETKFPELAREVAIVRVKFNQTYPNAFEEVNKRLVAFFGQDNSAKVKDSIADNTAQYLASSSLDKNGALDFIRNVSARADGNIEPPQTKRFINAAVFYEHPEREMVVSSQTYQSSGNPKALGVNLSVRMPFSWATTRDDDPKALFSWKSEAGSGMGFSSIAVKDLAGAPPTVSEIKSSAKFMTSPSFEIIPGGKVIKSSFVEMGNFPAILQTIEASQSRLGTEFFITSRILLVFDKNKLIALGCGVGWAKSEIAKIKQENLRLEKVCSQFFNSLNIQGKSHEDLSVDDLASFFGGSVWRIKETEITLKNGKKINQTPNCEAHFLRSEHNSICNTPEGEVTTSYDQVCSKVAANMLSCESTLGFSSKKGGEIGKKTKIDYIKHLDTLTSIVHQNQSDNNLPIKIVTVYSLLKR